MFAINEGCVKCYRELPSGKRALCAFLFGQDLFGLAENGRYMNTVQAITNVTLYRLSLVELTRLMKHDGDLQFQFLSKVTHELREAHRRAILINRRDAVGRFATFIAMMGSRAARRRPVRTCRCRWRARTSPTISACRSNRSAAAPPNWSGPDS